MTVMLHVRIIAVGGIKEAFWADAIAEYTKRMLKYCKLEILQVKESTIKKECEEISAKLKGHVLLFDINGELVSSNELSNKIAKLSQNKSTITFVIGAHRGVGAYLDDFVNEKISFGRITLPHQLFRVVAVEQIYRAFTIISGEKYHK